MKICSSVYILLLGIYLGTAGTRQAKGKKSAGTQCSGSTVADGKKEKEAFARRKDSSVKTGKRRETNIMFWVVDRYVTARGRESKPGGAWLIGWVAGSNVSVHLCSEDKPTVE